MPAGELLDRPRVLAIRSEPPALAPGETHTLTAYVFAVDGELDWSLCAEAWRPTDPPSCPDEAIELGRGNPLTTTLPELDSGWVLAAPVDGSALPAAKRLEAGTDAANPEVSGITTETPSPGDSEIELRVALADERDPAELVVSWYTTGGELETKRTLASEPVLLTIEEPATPVRVIAIVRETAGGTGWTETVLDPAELTP